MKFLNGINQIKSEILEGLNIEISYPYQVQIVYKYSN